MATKTSSCRFSGESLKKTEKRASDEGIPFSTAVKRYLEDAVSVTEGKPIVRWAVVDPESERYSLALHEATGISKAISALTVALNRPRPKTPEQIKEEAEIKSQAKRALAGTDRAIDQLRRSGQLLLPDVTPDEVKAALKNHKPGSVEWRLMAAYLGETNAPPEVKR